MTPMRVIYLLSFQVQLSILKYNVIIINLNKKECPDDVKLGLICQMLKSRRNSSKQELKLQELGVKDYKIKNASITFADKNNTKVDCGIYKSIFNEYFIKYIY